MKSHATWQTGLSSYAYRWSCAFPAACAADSMDVRRLIARAAQLDLQGVQICDNLPYQELSGEVLREIRREAADSGIFIETGARGTDPDYLRAMILASGRLGSRLLRVVAEVDRKTSASGISEQLDRLSDDILAVLGVAAQEGLRIALENHATLSSAELLYIMRTVGAASVGICLDTMNSVMLLERPLETARDLAPYTFCIHLKDFRMEKRPDDFGIVGVPLGEGLVDVAAVLRGVAEQEVRPSLHLELYVGRKESPALTRSYEDECVGRSAAYLKKILEELG